MQTSGVSQIELNALFAELVPDAKVHNIIDDSRGVERARDVLLAL